MSVVAPLPGPTEELPKVFGRYLLLKRLSRGGMGEIFLAKLGEIQGFEKLLIIKKILPNLVADQEFIKRFIDEAQVAIKLQHGNIAAVFEVGKVDGEYFLAIEHVEGRDLRRVIARLREERTRLPPDLALFIVRELASGLAYAHRRTDSKGQHLALVHCDISPPNVMVSFEGEVKVIDFGIAKSAIRIAETNPNMGFGKFGYMAPEQLLRGGVVDKRTDVYAAGVVLYELLTGERMLTFPEGADYRQIARTVTQGNVKPPSQRDPRLDRELDPIAMKALSPKKEDRYAVAEELRDAIAVKLSQMNPTMNSDALAHFLRGLFRDEIATEQQFVASMKAVDVAPFQDELEMATHKHTVTYARAPVPAVDSGVLDEIPTSEQVAHPQRKGLFFGLLALALFAGGAMSMLLARPARKVVVMPPRPAAETPTTPVVTPLWLPAKYIPRENKPEAKSVDHEAHETRHVPAKHPQKTVKVAAPPPKAVETHRPDQVQAKFRALKGEYSAFKSQYGGVLEDKWNSIANEITFGKADKYDKVDAMLDALRRDMQRIRNGS
jgi:serine/threonine protein kinase